VPRAKGGSAARREIEITDRNNRESRSEALSLSLSLSLSLLEFITLVLRANEALTRPTPGFQLATLTIS